MNKYPNSFGRNQLRGGASLAVVYRPEDVWPVESQSAPWRSFISRDQYGDFLQAFTENNWIAKEHNAHIHTFAGVYRLTKDCRCSILAAAILTSPTLFFGGVAFLASLLRLNCDRDRQPSTWKHSPGNRPSLLVLASPLMEIIRCAWREASVSGGER